ncbi:MAG: hypothetical protein M9927_08900 [Anaerolineae bacterium]|nr:hypothetical protein [Anaerolineae bacterium]
MTSFALREMPAELLPRRRIEWLGPGALTTSELLSLVIGSGRPGENAIRVAETVLVESGGLHGLRNMPDSELQRIAGIGPAKAAQIRAALELGRRFIEPPRNIRPQIRSPADAANLVLVEMSALEREELRAAAGYQTLRQAHGHRLPGEPQHGRRARGRGLPRGHPRPGGLHRSFT